MPSGRQLGQNLSDETLRTMARQRLAKKTKRAENGCLEWTGATAGKGYGLTSFGKELRHCYAHRLSYALHHGIHPKFEGVVRHTCDNPRCTEPAHLILGTTAENISDKVAKRRHHFGAKCYNAKLTDDAVRAIRADTRPDPVIAKEYGVTPMTIGKIQRGERWAHVA